MMIQGNDQSTVDAGFAAIPITPEVPDKWIDKNGDAEYRPKDGDTFIDVMATECSILYGLPDSAMEELQTEYTMISGPERWL